MTLDSLPCARLIYAFFAVSLMISANAQEPSAGGGEVPQNKPIASENSQKAETLDSLLMGAEFWSSPAEAFVATHETLGFEWLSSARNVAQTKREGGTLLGIAAPETLVRFDGVKPIEVVVSFYKYSENQELLKEDFEALIRKAVEALSAATQVRFVPRSKEASVAAKAEGISWQTAAATYLLEYSFTREVKATGVPFRVQFVRLQITPVEEKKSLVEEKMAGVRRQLVFRGMDKVVRDKTTGDVMLRDVPMIDQGDNGYSVVVSVERVLGFYGVKVNAEEMAQLAKASASRGTSVAAMKTSMERVGAKVGIRATPLIDLDAPAVTGLIADYNKAAEAAKLAMLPPESASMDLEDLLPTMNTALLREVRTKNKANMTAFERAVKSSIDKGTPLLWSMILGKAPEGGLSVGIMNGHMRLIVGYNEQSGQIIYSDAWGTGHEDKRMTFVNALTATTSLQKIDPQ
jgi:hypothetical protein